MRRLLLCLIVVLLCSSCASLPIMGSQNRLTIVKNDNTNPDRNRLLKQDIEYFAKVLPKRHKNLFAKLPKQEFEAMCAELAANVDKQNNTEVLTGLTRILGAVGDGHTNIGYLNNYSYPLRFRLFGEDVYIINADKNLGNIINTKVVRINGHETSEVLEKLSELIPYDNDSWLKALVVDYLRFPMYLIGLGLLDDETVTTFTVERDGKVFDVDVNTLKFGENLDLINIDIINPMIGAFTAYYDYKYIPEDKAFYFEYNVCADNKEKPFSTFNTEMFKEMESREVERLILDLRSNSGGNSEILNPFTDKLLEYITKNPDLKVFVLIGRETFSSGMFASLRTLKAAPGAVFVGEPTGGALDSYGEVKTFKLPNLKLEVRYSVKYFELSKDFDYKTNDTTTLVPNVYLEPTFADYLSGNDVVLNYALTE